MSASSYAQDDFIDRLLDLGSGDAVGDIFADLPGEPQALADLLSTEVAAIRGLAFREPIAVSNQSIAEFGSYVDAEMSRSLPPERSAVFGRVVETLGLYRGPRIEDPESVIRQLATSQVAAYYDPDRSEFFVVLQDAPPMLLGTIYAHELYHGLQDQYWDLDAYLLDAAGAGLDDDQILARQAVVEGEATYIMNLWMMERTLGRPPPRLAVGAAVLAQSMLSSSSLLAMASGGLPDEAGGGLQAAADAMDEIPAFLLETMIGAYLKGMAFVHAIVADGWENAARLYTDPPRSTEQILHPGKWLERDDPVQITLPEMTSESVPGDWRLLESNVIGEFQLRVIFQEFGLGAIGALAAAGWDGDRYAVLARGDEQLLLLRTEWDSEAEAGQFAMAYESLLGLKYPGSGYPVAIEQRGASVLIAEGGDRDQLAAYLAYLASATVTELTP